MYTNKNFIEGFQKAKDDLEDILRTVDDDLFVSQPVDGGWGIGEVVSHINKVTDLYLNQMEPGLNQPMDKLSKGSGPYSLPWTMRQFVKVVSPDYKPKIGTFPVFYPDKKIDLDRNKLVSRFNNNMDRFISVAQKAEDEDLNLDKIKVRNPVVKFLKMSLSACLAIHEAHTQRHLGQIKRLIPN
ncbi:MAG: DinB family protein [Balneolaceae bacterium]